MFLWDTSVGLVAPVASGLVILNMIDKKVLDLVM